MSDIVINTVYWMSVQNYWNIGCNLSRYQTYDESFLRDRGYKYTDSLKFIQKHFWKEFDVLARKGYLLFVITPEQMPNYNGFTAFLEATNLERYLVYSKHDIQNKNYPQNIARLNFYLFNVPKDAPTISMENIK